MNFGSVEYLREFDVSVVTIADGALTFGTKWGIGNFDFDDLTATVETIDALPFVRVEHVICSEKIRSSEKDHVEDRKYQKLRRRQRDSDETTRPLRCYQRTVRA
jgi:hypothetical protein